MSLYPSLEDMKVDHMAKAQIAVAHQQMHQQAQMAPPGAPPSYSQPGAPASMIASHSSAIYPSFEDYMGLDLSPEILAANNVVAVPPPSQIAVPVAQPVSNMIAPLSGNSLGLKRAEVTHGIREVVVCKDATGKIGLRARGINKGVFVVLVMRGTPASSVGLRFGDQILQINGENVAGYDTDKVHNIFKKLGPNNIRLAVRDRPFERTITLHKDSVGHIGFGFKNGRIHQIVKDSSAARNGLLTEHNILEVNGQNVVGVKDNDVTKIIEQGGNIITVTIMPSFIYDHMMKHMSSSLVRDFMDHSIYDV